MQLKDIIGPDEVPGFLDKIYNPGKDVLCLINEKGEFLSITPNCELVLGYPPNELIGKCVYDLIYEPDLSRTKELWAAIEAGEEHQTFQNTLRTKHGKLVNLCWFFRWDPLEQRCYAQFREQSDSATYTKLLERHREEVSSILDGIQEGFFAVDNNWIVTHWNRLTEKITGLSRSVAVGRKLWDIFPEAADKKSFYMLDEVRRTQQPQHFEEYYPELSLFADISVNPSPAGLSIFYRDITAQKLREKELETFHFIIQKASNLIMVMDDQGRLTWANDAFWETTGLQPDENVGAPAYQLLKGGTICRKALNELRRQVNQGQAFRGELQLISRDGKPFWVDLSCQPVYGSRGRLLKFITIASDITEQKDLEVQLEQERKKQHRRITLAAIKAQEEERSQIGLELHDDINQVLTTIKLYLELSTSGVPNTLELQRKSMDLLQHCINGIRSLSRRLSAPTLGKISLADSLRELVKSSGLMEKTNVHLDCLGVERVGINSDLHLAVYRIVQEQITNIIRHSGATEVAIKLWTDAQQLNLTIQDNGRGFTHAKPVKGVGIKNMKSRAESMGGSLEVKSSGGKGVLLQARFPMK